jgi:hypothetical protein
MSYLTAQASMATAGGAGACAPAGPVWHVSAAGFAPLIQQAAEHLNKGSLMARADSVRRNVAIGSAGGCGMPKLRFTRSGEGHQQHRRKIGPVIEEL